jgi:regulator of sigma E protease
MIILTIIVFIVMIAVLVLVHEFGHFIAAKKAGMKVEEFGFGFPPRIFGVRKGETIYSINWIPLGGFVRIVGEDNTEKSDPRSFVNKTFWQRFITLVAGVLMNVLLAWVLFSIGGAIGIPSAYSPGDQIPAHTTLQTQGITITEVEPGTPADQDHLQPGDVIQSVDGKTFADSNNMVTYLQTQEGKNVIFVLKREGQTVTQSVYSRPNPPANEGSIGIGVSDVGLLHYAWYAAPLFGIQQTWYTAESTVVGFYDLIRAGQGLSGLGGPVKIAQLTNQVTKLGLVYIIQFAAYLSVNLAILNIIPFPALDGGRVLFLIIEKVRRKPNSQNVEGMVNTVGFFVLLALIAVITFHDVLGLIHK